MLRERGERHRLRPGPPRLVYCTGDRGDDGANVDADCTERSGLGEMGGLGGDKGMFVVDIEGGTMNDISVEIGVVGGVSIPGI